MRPGLGGDAVVASTTMADGSTWVAFSEVYPGKRLAVLRSVTRQCAPNRGFGHGGAAAITISSHLKPGHAAALGSPSDGLWVNVLAPRNGGGAIVAGTYGGEWVVGEVTRSGLVDPTFGNSGWTVLPFRGEVTAVLQERSGRILIGGDNGGGGCAAAFPSDGVVSTLERDEARAGAEFDAPWLCFQVRAATRGHRIGGEPKANDGVAPGLG